MEDTEEGKNTKASSAASVGRYACDVDTNEILPDDMGAMLQRATEAGVVSQIITGGSLSESKVKHPLAI